MEAREKVRERKDEIEDLRERERIMGQDRGL